ncbi:SAM-dependent methyltransferase [Ahrensia sp. 13_GOM-1096m]|uniref:SAM-dependent methyltransferase n=1 Tax=Ahrensia sp. 13_GOM-1096m TaxID=1380380 RepID=UPI00047D63F8|nr:SAM-dependent methyltransferase [Ahrensia sp. 13_GOM-1096m]
MSIRTIIDKKQVDAAVQRAERLKIAGADFLLARILEDLKDRLDITNREFKSGRFVSMYPSFVRAHFDDQKTLQISAAMDDVQLRHGDILGLDVQSEDLIIDVSSLHQANDMPGMLIQYCRALKPDGLFLACVPGGDTLTELRQSLFAAESKISGGVRPRVLPFMDVRDAGGLLQRAGFALPVTDIDSVVVRYDTMFDLMLDLRAMGATNTLVERQKSLSRRDLFHNAAQHYAENFADSDGRIRATFSFIWMSGWAPDASQPQPLKPGSATQSLAKVLKDRTANS